ncbi:hypothetical protein [Psychroserpens sp.]|uniref:hypothetical protein n=1 Tax=Psychroserpens sp. TaxID=2020870 RepID=UPI002B270BF0|nr:hypothetical protein [Psychroserpens sp.]
MRTKTVLINTLLAFLVLQVATAQNQNSDVDLISVYKDYTEMEREIAYAHLNKSIYIKGESIGIKAYVFDKYNKQLATQATNLYCTISDTEGKIIVSKMLMITNGTAIADFEIDDRFSSAHYTINLYTNWMKNFAENNVYTETIRIIDPELEKTMISSQEPLQIDAQFLPEGGHLLANVDNTIGVVIKNEKGIGISGVEGEIIDQNGVVVTNFKVNQFGIGKCLLNPKANVSYSAQFDYDEQRHTIAIKHIKTEGISMSLLEARGNVAITLKTNPTTLKRITGQLYKLVIHNGEDIKETLFKFSENTEELKIISNSDLFKGINIFTVFDSNNNPLIERLYFNYDGFKFIESSEAITKSANDSITITLPYMSEPKAILNSFSVSVLPSKSNSIHHQNMASYILMQSYLKGYVEQAAYYFTGITPKKKFELDNLLITQGWSSYDWNTIFNNPPDYAFDYENGISYTINSQQKEDQQLMIYPTLNHPMKLINLTKDNTSYTAAGLFPIDDEQIRVRALSSSGKASKPSLYIQFDPFKIPEIKTSLKPLMPNINTIPYSKTLTFESTLRQVEQLEEVIINKKKAYTKIEKLQNRSLGKVEMVDEVLERRYRTLVRYLRDKGFKVVDTPTKFEIYSNSVNSTRDRIAINVVESDPRGVAAYDPNGPALHLNENSAIVEHASFDQDAGTSPIVYLDGTILHQDLTILKNLTMDQIEYVEVNRSGIGGGMRSGGAGLIRIKTKPQAEIKIETDNVNTGYEIPLNFSVAKQFYVPVYKSYDNDFFKEFGIIDWIPNLNLNANGNLEFKIADRQLTEFNCFIEGTINDKTFVSEIKTIKLK